MRKRLATAASPAGRTGDYWSNGLLACEGRYASGAQEGEWRFYNPDGTLREVILFEGGREVVDRAKFFGRKDGDK